MKRLIRLFCLIAAATALGSCARDKVIPDEELARIFRDAYLINAYVSDRGVKLDSLELYEPVFSRYGYTAEDVRYTIGNFSRRKSAKLSDVVERSIRLLEEESAYYKYEVSVLDTINNVARRRFTRTVYSDSLIRATRIKDTARLRIRIPDIRPGEYRVSFDYLIDSLDENLAPRMRIWLVGPTVPARANPPRSCGSRAGSVFPGYSRRTVRPVRSYSPCTESVKSSGVPT